MGTSDVTSLVSTWIADGKRPRSSCILRFTKSREKSAFTGLDSKSNAVLTYMGTAKTTMSSAIPVKTTNKLAGSSLWLSAKSTQLLTFRLVLSGYRSISKRQQGQPSTNWSRQKMCWQWKVHSSDLRLTTSSMSSGHRTYLKWGKISWKQAGSFSIRRAKCYRA